MPLFDEGASLYHNEEKEQLKMRYAYQLIRMFHYDGQYNEAIRFFNERIEKHVVKNEIFYYILNHIAGCYYALGIYDNAAYLFLNIFDKSKDKKTSAYVSYSFCTNKGAEGKKFFKDTEDRATYLLIKYLRQFSDRKEGLYNMFEMVPGDPKLELLFVRSINSLERSIWPTHTGLSRATLPNIKPAIHNRIDMLHELADRAINHEAITTKDFWRLAASYLLFIEGNIEQAQNLLANIKNKSYQKQKNALNAVYKAFTWEKIEAEQEEFLAGVLDSVITEKPVGRWEVKLPGWKYLILDRTGHLYYNNGQIGKAFLTHNSLKNLEQITSFMLIDSLETFINKENKNKFEKILMRRVKSDGDYTINDMIYNLKGLYFLRNEDPESASHWFGKTKLKKMQALNGGLFISQIKALIFSNNIKECFNCPENDVMADEMYLEKDFSFIKRSFTASELTKYLMKLEEMAYTKNKIKSSKAFYLLGNYYFNISNTGYYRGILKGSSNIGWSKYLYHDAEEKSLDDILKATNGYNLFGIGEQKKWYWDYAVSAEQYYKKALENSTDKEFQARCLYMMAKCELNMMYNSNENSYSWYSGDITPETQEYKTSFATLRDDYSDTQFYNQIINECAFFEMYCAIR